MSSAALVRIEPNAGDDLVAQMTEALAGLEELSPVDLAMVRQDASAVEAAAKQKKSLAMQLAAAKLRLYAERRLGELGVIAQRAHLEYSATEWRDFGRLAAIPRSFRMFDLVAEAADVFDPLGGDLPVNPHRPQPKIVDLFVRAVAEQLRGTKSHTAYSVYLASLDLSLTSKGVAKHRALWRAWDGSWKFLYQDARTKRYRQARYTGTLEGALEHRAVLEGKISAKSPKLIPVGDRDPLSGVLDAVRQARQALGDCWSNLTVEQKKELDGAYSALDDLAHKTVAAVNL